MAKSCLALSDISEHLPQVCSPVYYLDCFYDSDRLLPAFWPCLPSFWYPLCLLPAPTIALPLLINLPCLRYTSSCYRTLPVWPPLVYINKAAFGSQRHWPLWLQNILYILNIHICKYPNTHTYVCVWFITDREIPPEFMIKKKSFRDRALFLNTPGNIQEDDALKLQLLDLGCEIRTVTLPIKKGNNYREEQW